MRWVLLSCILSCALWGCYGQSTWPDCAASSPDTCDLPLCPDCSLVDCMPKLEQSHCPVGAILEDNLVMGGCCPACVFYLQRDADCLNPVDTLPEYELLQTFVLPCTDVRVFSEESFVAAADGSDLEVPVLTKYECSPSSNCDEETGTCQPLQNSACIQSQDEYEVWLDSTLDGGVCEDCKCAMQYESTCSAYGMFDNVQQWANDYVVESRAFCADPTGKRIFGSVRLTDSVVEDATCACSRKFWELTSLLDREDVTLHCTAEGGNFEGLQCDSGRCWCADERTGTATTAAVHERHFHLLPCYTSEEEVGSQYLRKCESRTFGKAVSRETLLKHGLVWTEHAPVTCDWDGSFTPLRCNSDDQVCRCVDRNGGSLQGYQSLLENVANMMGCRCARDKADRVTSLVCTSEVGKYNEVQLAGSGRFEFCVDERDGFRKTPNYPTAQNSPSGSPCYMQGCLTRETYCAETTCDFACPTDCASR